MVDPDEQGAWTMVNKINNLIEERDALVAERDEARQIIKNIEPPYMEATQEFIDTICHYRNLAISLGAKPDDMTNSWDRKLAESGIGDGNGGWDNDAPDVWLQLEAAEAERDDAIARCEKWRTLAEGWKLTDDVRQHRVSGVGTHDPLD